MSKRKKPLSDFQWGRIEIEYRAGLKTLVQIGSQYDVTAGAISQMAKKRGWERDLSAKAKLKAAEIVRDAEISAMAIPDEVIDELADYNAKILASVKLGQRADVTRARALTNKLMDELECVFGAGESEQLNDLANLVENEVGPQAVKAFRRVMSIGERVELAKSMAISMKTLISLESEVYGLNEKAEDKGDPLQELIIRISTGNNSTLLPVGDDSDFVELGVEVSEGETEMAQISESEEERLADLRAIGIDIAPEDMAMVTKRANDSIDPDEQAMLDEFDFS